MTSTKLYSNFIAVESPRIVNLSASARPVCVKVTQGSVIDFGLCVIGGAVAKDVKVKLYFAHCQMLSV